MGQVPSVTASSEFTRVPVSLDRIYSTFKIRDVYLDYHDAPGTAVPTLVLLVEPGNAALPRVDAGDFDISDELREVLNEVILSRFFASRIG